MVMPMCTKDSSASIFPPREWNFNEYSDGCFKRFGVRPLPNLAVTTYGDKLT